MPHDLRKSVWDALNACKKIQSFTTGQTLEAYLADEMRCLAVERLFTILGEAFNRIDDVEPSFRDRFPEMGQIIGMRNLITHGYDRVNDEMIFDSIRENVPTLADKLAEWLDEHQM